jgi:predicted MFS family arabinose efflux permease
MRFTGGEFLANAAWAGMLTYSGALLIESYGATRATVALGLGVVAAAMVPGTFLGRRSVERATPERLAALTLMQACAVVVLGALRPAAGLTLAVLTVMAFTNGWRSIIAGGLGMGSAPDDKVAVMSLRAAANQFGYLLGAAAGGLALATGGFVAFGGALSALFVLGALLHLYSSLRTSLAARSPERTAPSM